MPARIARSSGPVTGSGGWPATRVRNSHVGCPHAFNDCRTVNGLDGVERNQQCAIVALGELELLALAVPDCEL